MTSQAQVIQQLTSRLADLELLLKAAEREQDPAKQFIVECEGIPLAYTECADGEFEPKATNYESATTMRFLRARQLARVTRNGSGTVGQPILLVTALGRSIRELQKLISQLEAVGA